jgi:hypothetical protein
MPRADRGDAGSHLFELSNSRSSQRYAGSGLGSGAGVCPSSPSFPSPSSEGDGAPKRRLPDCSGCPDSLRTGPDRRALALMTRAPAPLGAPPRHRSAFAFHGGRTCRGLSTPWQATRVPPECMGANHARRCSVPPHFVRRLGRSAPQSTELILHIVKFTQGVNRPRGFIVLPVIAAFHPIEPPRETATCRGAQQAKSQGGSQGRRRPSYRLRSVASRHMFLALLGVIPTCTSCDSSCAGLTRASISLRIDSYEEDGLPGQARQRRGRSL